eukprot:1478240-Ditylum_brightwellii.AAC.1
MANPTGSNNSNKAQTNTLAIFARGPYAKLSGALIEEVVEMIGNKNKIKFVPFSLKYDQTIKNNKNHYLTLLCKQNAYLVEYADFCAGGLTEKVLRVEISRKTVHKNTLESPYAVDMHKTTYTDKKGIWKLETTKGTLHKAMSEINKILESLQDILSDEHFAKKQPF